MSKRELQYALLWGAVILAVTCIPYAVVWWYTPLQGVFPLVLFNSDDHGVYFAWMRQAHDGHLLFRNLFTPDPQRGIYPHLYFLVLGWVARLPGLDLPLAYHLGRILSGIGVLVLAYRLGCFFTPSLFTRRCIFWLTATSAGLGWLPGLWTDRIVHSQPIDVWQAEALTFPSLYTNGLFAFSMALMLGVVICLLLAERHGARWAVAAGLCGLVLGNVHSYDMIHLTAAWGAYLLLRWAFARRFPAREIGLALLAAAIAAPSVLFMAWLYRTEPVFRMRADVGTWTPMPHLYLLGYGLLVPLAVWGACLLLRRAEGGEPDLQRLFPPAWAVGGFLVAYVPVAFQRKMVMGEHFPLALLAGLAVAEVARRVSARTAGGSAARGAVAAAALVAVMALSNVRYLYRDVHVALTTGLTSTQVHPVYWPAGYLRAWEWLGRNGGPETVLLSYSPWGVLAPAYSGRTVYAGHWGETPDWERRVVETNAFYTGRSGSAGRVELLHSRGITHVLVGPPERQLLEQGQRQYGSASLETEPFLKPVFTSEEATLYAVQAPAGALR